MRVPHSLVRKRLFVALVVITLVFLALFGRLAYVQLIRGDWLAGRAQDLWTRNIPFEAQRGRIVDRNGDVLVDNVSAPSVMAIPAQIKNPAETARTLARLLRASEEEIYRKITKREMIVRLSPEGRKIPEELARKIQGLRLPGIVVVEDSKRHYPHGSLAAHLLGFTGIDNQGLSGIELVYDEQLAGTPGYVSFSANAKGEKLPGGEDRYTAAPGRNGLDADRRPDDPSGVGAGIGSGHGPVSTGECPGHRHGSPDGRNSRDGQPSHLPARPLSGNRSADL